MSEAKWKIDWRGNIVPEKASVPSASPRFDSPSEAQSYIRHSKVRAIRGQDP